MPADNDEIVIDLDAVGRGPAARGALRGNWDGCSPKGDISRVIRRDAFERVLAKLVIRPLDITEREDFRSRRPLSLDVIPNRSHDAILVGARRGDGKTTFLTDMLTLIQDVQKGADDFDRYLDGAVPRGEVGSLYSLGIVDPTLIEAKQHIVVIIIEKIKAAVDRAQEGAVGGGHSYDAFKNGLYELASGLTLLDGIGDSVLQGKDWADPDYILDKGLDRANAAGSFERAFRRYVAEAARYLGVDAFVLAIDDVDTSFERGWPVLEALRKYLASPQLKVILAGDPKLYNLLVRQQQWKQMTREFIEVERLVPGEQSYRDQIASMIDVLQDQYLIKIVRPENRVGLNSLLQYANTVPVFFRSSRRGDGRTHSQAEVFDLFAGRLLSLHNVEDCGAVRAAVLRLPLRSSLQVLSGAWSLITLDGWPNVLLDGTWAAGIKEGRASSAVRPTDDALDALRHVSSQSLMSLDLDQDALKAADPDRLFGVLSQWMTRRELWLKMARFYPEGEAEDRDVIAILVAGTLTKLFRTRPRTIFDYWLRICTIREILDRYEAKPDSGFADLQTHLRGGTGEGMVQFVSRLSAWQAADANSANPSIRLNGIAVPATLNLGERSQRAYTNQLYGLAGEEFDRKTFAAEVAGGRSKKLLGALPAPLRGYHRTLSKAGWTYSSRRGTEPGLTAAFVNSLGSVERRLPENVAAVFMIPAARMTSAQLAESSSYTFLRLLGFVGELLDVGSRTMGGERETAIRDLLAQFSLLRSYPTPQAREPSSDPLGEEGSEQTEESEDDRTGTDVETQAASTHSDIQADPPGQRDVAKLLGEWLNAVQAAGHSSEVSTIALARAWTRFTYAFDSIVDDLRHTETRYLGVVIHRAIIAFWHAVGVETMHAAGRAPTTKTIKNPIKSSENFRQLVKEIDDFKGLADGERPQMWLFETIFTCPIWGFFLARNDAEIAAGNDLATGHVFALYMARMRALGINPVYDVEFVATHGKTRARFDGFYPILNTIPIQDSSRRIIKTPAAQKLSKTLSDLALSKPDVVDSDEPNKVKSAPQIRTKTKKTSGE